MSANDDSSLAAHHLEEGSLTLGRRHLTCQECQPNFFGDVLTQRLLNRLEVLGRKNFGGCEKR